MNVNNTAKLENVDSVLPAGSSSEYSAPDSSGSESDSSTSPPMTPFTKELAIIQNKSPSEIMKEIEHLNSLLSSSSAQHIIDQKALLEAEISLLHQGILACLLITYIFYRDTSKTSQEDGEGKERL